MAVGSNRWLADDISIPKPINKAARIGLCKHNERHTCYNHCGHNGPNRKLTGANSSKHRKANGEQHNDWKADKSKLERAVLNPPAKLLRVRIRIRWPVIETQPRLNYVAKEREEQEQWKCSQRQRHQRKWFGDATFGHTRDDG